MLIILFMLFISFMVVLISLLPGGRSASQSITNHEEFKNYSIEMITAENNAFHYFFLRYRDTSRV